jgi:superfamily II DNA/RNA helicase
VAAENYEDATRLKKLIQEVEGNGAVPSSTWQQLGIPEWLADRADRLGFQFPTNVQQRAIKSILLGADAVIRAETGSGKTLAFVLPTLAMLDYPPAMCVVLEQRIRARAIIRPNCWKNFSASFYTDHP